MLPHAAQFFLQAFTNVVFMKSGHQSVPKLGPSGVFGVCTLLSNHNSAAPTSLASACLKQTASVHWLACPTCTTWRNQSDESAKTPSYSRIQFCCGCHTFTSKNQRRTGPSRSQLRLPPPQSRGLFAVETPPNCPPTSANNCG